MKKTCTVSGEEFEITEDDLRFYEKMDLITKDDLSGLPNLCPAERQRRRIAFRNFRSLYSRKCDATGKKLISMYSEDKPFPVYENQYWWSDKWKAKDFGIDFDFSKTFFQNYEALSDRVPRYHVNNIQTENCGFSNMIINAKNCYLIFGGPRSEDCLYGHIIWDSENCVDNLYIFRCTWCSNSVDLVDCYDVHFSTESTNCSESYFLHDCLGCKNCFGCTNLRQKQYYFFNQKLSKEAYFKKLEAIFPLKNKIVFDGKNWLEREKIERCIFPKSFSLKSEDFSGNHIYESKNIVEGYDVKQSEDSKFLFTAFHVENSYDMSFVGSGPEFCYEGLTVHGSNNTRFCHLVGNCSDTDYAEFCYYSKNLFGCNGMRNAQYCILNRQYSKEDYSALRDKIIAHMKKTGEWGEFFPIKISPFAYNESIVQEYFPLTEEAILSRGYKWKAEDSKNYQPQTYEVPDSITDVSESICKEILACDKCQKNYKIISQELKFYKKMNLPIPHKCPDCRHKDRMALRNPRKLWQRTCDKEGCEVRFQTTFAPERPEKVYCEKCYLEVVD